MYQKIPESSTVQFLLSVVQPDSIVPVIVEIMLKEKNRGGPSVFLGTLYPAVGGEAAVNRNDDAGNEPGGLVRYQPKQRTG